MVRVFKLFEIPSGSAGRQGDKAVCQRGPTDVFDIRDGSLRSKSSVIQTPYIAVSLKQCPFLSPDCPFTIDILPSTKFVSLCVDAVVA